MQKKYKVMLLAALIVAIGFIMLAPQLGLKEKVVGKFAVTPRPAEALAAAEKSGRPVFLEFYAKW